MKDDVLHRLMRIVNIPTNCLFFSGDRELEAQLKKIAHIKVHTEEDSVPFYDLVVISGDGLRHWFPKMQDRLANRAVVIVNPISPEDHKWMEQMRLTCNCTPNWVNLHDGITYIFLLYVGF